MWLLESSIRQAFDAARKAGIIPTADQQAQFEATHFSALTEGGSQILTMAGSSAEISIHGVLTQTPNLMAKWFGGGNTTYPDIISALHEANNNASVADITLSIDSPGGTVDGLFDLLDNLKSIHKPVKAIGVNLVASAAYAIASQADTIESSNDSTRFGSIGIVASFMVSDNEIKITSTRAPKKAPDVTTEEGVAMVREELDALHDLFVNAIADGRGGTTEDINANFGQGGTVLAGEALKRGMIDSITKKPLQSVNHTNTPAAVHGGDHIKVKVMNLSELRATHPEAYDAAVSVGTTQERDRVGAHLIMGKSSGDMDTAIKACQEGTEMNGVMTATYLSATASRSDIAAADADAVATALAADNANAEETTTATDAETIAAGLEAHFGTEVKV